MASNIKFRTLPFPIIDAIIENACQTKSEYDTCALDTTQIDPLVQIMHTCHNWRQAALLMMFRKAMINLKTSCMFAYSFGKAVPRFLNNCCEQYNGYVRFMELSFKLCHVIDGQALKMIKASEHSSITLPNVANIKVRIIMDSLRIPDYSHSEANISAFVNHIRHMLPALNKVTFDFNTNYVKLHIENKPHLQKLTAEISENCDVSDIIIGSIVEAKFVKTIPLFENLASIECYWHHEYLEIANIIHRNASTLTNLCIYFHEFAGISALLRNEDTQAYICYPHLNILQLSGDHFLPGHVIPPTGNVVVFPCLRYVSVGFEYPFSDDVLFRGNQWRLKGVFLVLNTRLIQCLATSKVLNSNRLNIMEEVVIADNKYLEEDLELDDISTQFFQQLISCSKYLSIHPQNIYNMLLQSIPTEATYSNLYCLNISFTTVTFSEIVLFLEKLPKLTVIRSKISAMGDLYNNINAQKVIDSLRTRYNTLNSCLQTWSIVSANMTNSALTACCIMALADRCPRLKHVVFRETSFIALISIFQKLQKLEQKIKPSSKSVNPKVTFKQLIKPNIYVIDIEHK